MTEVRYRIVSDYPAYRVGDDGSVWSLWVRKGPRETGRGSAVFVSDTWHEIGQSIRRNYPVVMLIASGKRRRQFLVHRLVLEAFVGPCPDGMEGCHNDGNPANNRLENLRWDNHRGNLADALRHGTRCRGETHGRSSLSTENVLAIRNEYAAGGVSQQELSVKYHVSQSHIHRITSRKKWAHLV